MRTRLCDLLAIDHPILNAPMGMVAGAPLAAGVSASGGLGLIGGAFRDPDGLRAAIRAARDLSDRRVGVGFISHPPETHELAPVALDEGITVVAHSFADPTPFVAPAHDQGWLCTRLEATPEAAVGRSFRERLVSATTDDTVLTGTFDLAIRMDWPDGIAMRALRNRFTDEWHGREDEVRAWSQARSDEYSTYGFFSPDEGVMPAGESVGVVASVEPAGEPAGPRPQCVQRQKGWPAGSSMTRSWSGERSGGWGSASRAPRATAWATAAPTSSAWISKCIILVWRSGSSGQTGGSYQGSAWQLSPMLPTGPSTKIQPAPSPSLIFHPSSRA